MFWQTLFTLHFLKVALKKQGVRLIQWFKWSVVVMTIIGNIGIGILLLTILWILTLFIVVIGVRLQSNISWIILGSATAITILFLIIPTDKEIQLNNSVAEDYCFIHKNISLSILLLSCIIGFGSFFVVHCTYPVHPDAIQSAYCEYD